MTQAVATPLTAAWLTVLERNLAVIKQNLEGLGHEQSLISFMEGGSHLNWLVGHLTHTRCGILRSLGADAPWGPEKGERYGNGSTPAPADEAEPLAELLAALEATQPPLEEALGRATGDDLERPLGKGTVGRRVEFLVWHDSYHVGQTSIYRRLAGLERQLP